MRVRELRLPGALEVTPVQHGDERGLFLEWFREDEFTAATGQRMHLAQANCSVSALGALRGIHFAELPPGQAKYISCPSGAAFDVLVDLRIGSPTYGEWDAVVLDDRDRRAVYVPEGFGHAFLSLAERTVVNYLCSTPFTPGREHAIHPFDAEIGIEWPTHGRDGERLHPVLSPKDDAAPSLAETRARGVLPTYADWLTFTGAQALT